MNPPWSIIKTISSGDYLRALVPDHPNRNKHNYVLLHRVIAENTIGRILKPDEVVHHINEDKRDNRPENLQVMTVSDHAKLHMPSGQKMVKIKCPSCGDVFEVVRRNSFLCKSRGASVTLCSRRCIGKMTKQLAKMSMQGRAEIASKSIIQEFIG